MKKIETKDEAIRSFLNGGGVFKPVLRSDFHYVMVGSIDEIKECIKEKVSLFTESK